MSDTDLLVEEESAPSSTFSQDLNECISQPFKFNVTISSNADRTFKENVVGQRDVVFDILIWEKSHHLSVKLNRTSQRLSDVLICNCFAEMFAGRTKIFDKLWFRPSTLVAGINKSSHVDSVKLVWVPTADLLRALKQHQSLTITIFGFAVYKKQSSFLQHINTYLESNKETCDVTLKVGDKTFPGHKWLLSARSPVFKRMFEDEKKDNKEVTIDDVEPNVFGEILNYMYTGTCPKIREMASDLLLPADVLGLEDLKLHCGEELIKHISPANVSTYLMLSSESNADQLYDKCLDYFYENITEVVLTPTWQKFRSTADVTFGFKLAERIATRPLNKK